MARYVSMVAALNLLECDSLNARARDEISILLHASCAHVSMYTHTQTRTHSRWHGRRTYSNARTRACYRQLNQVVSTARHSGAKARRTSTQTEETEYWSRSLSAADTRHALNPLVEPADNQTRPDDAMAAACSHCARGAVAHLERTALSSLLSRVRADKRLSVHAFSRELTQSAVSHVCEL